MRRALKLAHKGRGRVSPNPRVGAVLVGADGNILSEGYHSRIGSPHAEAVALEACKGEGAHGATLYINLEPCCFQGKTPPCSTAIIRAGIDRVVSATHDPDYRVNRSGFAKLKEAGIRVDVGLMADEARYLNRGYFSSRERGRAWCAVKVALSLDGRMAATDGESRWITGPEARKLTHRLRADHDGVLVGGGTVKRDNPELTVRNVHSPNPVRIILAPHSGIPTGSRLAETAGTIRTVLVTDGSNNPPGCDLEGIEILRLPTRDDEHIDPHDLLKHLPEIGVQSLLIEGGAGVLSSFMEADVIDEIWVCMAPSVIGKGISPFERFMPESWEGRPRFAVHRIKRYGEDIVITFRRKL